MTPFEMEWEEAQEQARRQEEERNAFANKVREALGRISDENAHRAREAELQRIRERYELEPGQPLTFGRQLYFDYVRNPLQVLGMIKESDPRTFWEMVIFGPPLLLLWGAWKLFFELPARTARDALGIVKWIVCWLVAWAYVALIGLCGLSLWYGTAVKPYVQHARDRFMPSLRAAAEQTAAGVERFVAEVRAKDAAAEHQTAEDEPLVAPHDEPDSQLDPGHPVITRKDHRDESH